MSQASSCPYCGNIGYHVWAGSGGCPGAVSERERDAVAAVLLRDLKEQFQKAKEWNQLAEIQIKNLRYIVEAQNDLLTRAANVLEIIDKEWPISELGLDPAIITELRKAAE